MSGPELRYKRDTETGFFSTPQFFVGETGGRGSAAELAFVGPDQYKITTRALHDLRRADRGLVHPDG